LTIRHDAVDHLLYTRVARATWARGLGEEPINAVAACYNAR